MNDAERLMNNLLEVAGIPRRASYAPGEVCSLLGISSNTLWRMTAKWERHPQTGEIPPGALDSFFLRGHRRIAHAELVRYLADNRTWERTCRHDPHQGELF
jgi:hypothetical protein